MAARILQTLRKGASPKGLAWMVDNNALRGDRCYSFRRPKKETSAVVSVAPSASGGQVTSRLLVLKRRHSPFKTDAWSRLGGLLG